MTQQHTQHKQDNDYDKKVLFLWFENRNVFDFAATYDHL
jgi:hypothetical protein